jgi:hypothetical protein
VVLVRQCFLRIFTGLDLAPGEFPFQRMGHVRPALPDKDEAGSLDNGGDDGGQWKASGHLRCIVAKHLDDVNFRPCLSGMVIELWRGLWYRGAV